MKTKNVEKPPPWRCKCGKQYAHSQTLSAHIRRCPLGEARKNTYRIAFEPKPGVKRETVLRWMRN